MPLEGENYDELLSALLDGQLSDAESDALQRELESSESLRAQFQELKELSVDVKAAFSIAPQSSLPADFRDRVVAEAETRLSESRSVEPVSGASQAASPVAASPLAGAEAERSAGGLSERGDGRGAGRLTAIMTAVVAALVLLAALPMWLDGDGDAPKPVASGTSDDVTPEDQALATDQADDRSSDPNEAISPGMDNAIASNPPESSALDDGNSQPVRYLSELAVRNRYFFVVDVEMSIGAFRSNKLRQVLQSYNILEERPIVDPAFERTLRETEMIMTDGGAGKPPLTAVYLIRADIAMIGKALEDIYFDMDGFPNLAFNIAMDNPSTRLIERIFRSTGNRFTVDDQFSAPVTADEDAIGGALFQNVRPPEQFVSASARQANGERQPAMVPADLRGEISTVLLLVRQPR